MLKRWVMVSMCALLSTRAMGQRFVVEAGGDEQPGAAGVFVRDSAIAQEKLSLAQRMERLAEWDTSADVYQEVLKSYGDRVLRDPTTTLERYHSVTTFVQQRLAAWPEAGRSVYEQRFGVEAQRLLDAATTRTQLHKVLSDYFITPAGAEAGVRLCADYFEAGEFSAAALLGDRLLKIHPALGERRPLLLARTALAHHLAGHAEAATATMETLKKESPEVRAVIAGTDQPLAAAIEPVLQQPIATAKSSSDSSSWTMPFGSSDRARVGEGPPGQGMSLAPLYSVPLALNLPDTGNDMTGQQINPAALIAGSMSGVMPVVDRGELFFQDNASVYAIALETGQPLPGWSKSFPTTNGRFSSVNPSDTTLMPLATVLEGDRVLAVLGQLSTTLMNNGGRTTNQLVALDRTTGQLKWSFSMNRINAGQGDQNVLQTMLSGSPMVLDDAVYVIATSGIDQQFADNYLVCLSLSDGSPRWYRHLFSSTQSRNAYDLPMSRRQGSHLLYANGRVIVSTNAGAVAAVDAFDGAIAWITLYQRPQPVNPNNFGMNRRAMAMNQRAPTPGGNPPIYTQGQLFVLPGDGDAVLLLDAGTGEINKRIPTATLDQASTLIGVIGDQLLVSSRTLVSNVRWKTFREDGDRVVDNVFWDSRFVAGKGGGDIAGRPFLTDKSLYVPGTARLSKIDLASGKRVDDYPRAGGWNDDEKPGNVLITPSAMVMAAADRVGVYINPDQLMARLESRIQAQPNDYQPRLQFAQAMFAAERLEIAQKRFDEALALVGENAPRSELHDSAMNIASKLANRAGDVAGPSRTAADTMFDRAKTTATTPSQQARYAFVRSEFLSSSQRVKDSVELLQSILESPELSAVQVQSSGRVQQARTLAEQRIGLARGNFGADVYAAIETRAQAQLAAARAAGDAAALLQVAMQFPNASTTEAALKESSEALVAANEPARALQALRLLSQRTTDASERSRLSVRQARVLATMPGTEDEVGDRLRIAKALDGDAQLDVQLKVGEQTFESGPLGPIVAKLDALWAKRSEDRLPVLSEKPFDPAAMGIFADKPITSAGVRALLAPVERAENYTRLAVATLGNAIRVIDVSGATQWETPHPIAQQALEVAWNGEQLLVIAAKQVAAFDSRGQSLWTCDIPAASESERDLVVLDNKPRLVEVNREQAKTIVRMQQIQQRAQIRGQMNNVVINGQMFIDAGAVAGDDAAKGEGVFRVAALVPGTLGLILDDGRILGIDTQSGKLAWQRALLEKPMQLLHRAGPFLAVASQDMSENGGGQVGVVDVRTGQVLLLTRPPMQGQQIIDIVLGEGGLLCTLGTNVLVTHDLYNGNDQPLISKLVRPNAQVFRTNVADSYIIRGQTLMAVTEAQTTAQFVRFFDVLSGLQMQTKNAAGKDSAIEFSPEAGAAIVRLQAAGDRLFMLGPTSVKSVYATKPSPAFEPWTKANTPDSPAGAIPGTIARLLLYRDHAVAMGVSQENGQGFELAFSRKLVSPGVESGLCDDQRDMLGMIDTSAFVAINGAASFLRSDNTLCILPIAP